MCCQKKSKACLKTIFGESSSPRGMSANQILPSINLLLLNFFIQLTKPGGCGRPPADPYPASLSGKYRDGRDTHTDKKQRNTGRNSRRDEAYKQQRNPANHMQSRPDVRHCPQIPALGGQEENWPSAQQQAQLKRVCPCGCAITSSFATATAMSPPTITVKAFTAWRLARMGSLVFSRC